MAESEVTVQILGFIEANTLLVTEIDGGTIYVGMPIFGDGIAEGTIVTAFGTGTGGLGSYEVNINQTAAGPGLTSILITGITGPPYPLGPLPGSNGFGSFIFGVSPFGDIPPFDVWRTIISQYANSEILTTLILNLYSYLDQTANIESFFDNIMNIESAQGYGLDVWGRILGVGRVLQIAQGGQFGFEEALPGSGTFGQGTFFSGGALTSNFSLADAPYRALLLTKAAANITDCSIPAINQILLSLFPNRGPCYVTDGLDMSMTYTFKFVLSPVDIAIVEQSGALPKPVGVKATVVISP